MEPDEITRGMLVVLNGHSQDITYRVIKVRGQLVKLREQAGSAATLYVEASACRPAPVPEPVQEEPLQEDRQPAQEAEAAVQSAAGAADVQATEDDWLATHAVELPRPDEFRVGLHIDSQNVYRAYPCLYNVSALKWNAVCDVPEPALVRISGIINDRLAAVRKLQPDMEVDLYIVSLDSLRPLP